MSRTVLFAVAAACGAITANAADAQDLPASDNELLAAYCIGVVDGNAAQLLTRR